MGKKNADEYIKGFYNPYQDTTADGVGAIAQGAKAIAMEDGAVAIGTAASAMSKESLALGVATVTTGERAIGVGSLAVASGDRSVAIGTYTNRPDSTLGETRYDSPRALGDDAVAIGAGAYVGVDVLGTKSVALGAGSIVTTSYGDLKENLTTGAWEGTLRNYKSYDPNKTPGVNADGETDKQFTRGNTTTGGSTGTVDKAYVGRLIYRDFAGATAVGAVSVGYAGAEKRIQNVAAGEISPTSTDAINGSQLYIATYELGYQIESSHFHTNDGTGTQEEGNTVTNKGKLAETAGARSKYATTAGVAARAVGEAAVAVGHNTLTGLTKAQYDKMVVIDKALAEHKAKRQKAQDRLEAAEKTLSLARSRLPILNAELANYAQGLAELEGKIRNASNPDESARLTEQRAKMLASKQLVQEQRDKLAKDQAKATTDKQTSEAEIATLDGNITTAKEDLAEFLRANAKDHAVALGSNIEASGEKSVAIGKDVKVSGNQSIAVGYGNVVSGDNSGAFGDPSIVAGAGSYTQGNDNAVGSQAKNVGAFGNNNQIGATATYVDGKLQTADGLANESAVENSRVVGNNNYINTNNTYVLGSGVGVEGTDNFGTVENSVYLGNDSTVKDSDVAITKNNVGTVKNLTKGNVAGSTSTAGSKGTVTNAELFGVTYGEFAGATAKGAVTVGSASEERRIMNVAAGEISNTSTDAINGSQLYYVAKQAATPFTVTANSNKDTDAKNLDKQYAGGDGKQVQLGETLNIAGSKTSKNLTRDESGVATDSTYSAKNIQTIVDDNGVQIQMAEKPEFKEVTAKDGTNVSKLSPTNITTTDGTSTTTIAPDSITVGDKAGNTDTPITISSTTTDGNTKNVIDGLTNNLPETKNATDDTTTKTQDAPTDTAINNNAATVGDVLNAGWNLKAQDQAVDFVKPYDTVNIKGDGAINVAGTNTDGATSTVTISVATTTLKDEKKAGDNNTLVDGKDGKVDAPAEGDKNKLVTAENIANAINNSGFTLKSSAVANQGEKLTGTQTGDEVINPGDVIEMVAGKNMTVKQDQNGKITYATKDNVEFNTVKVGTTGTGTDTKKPVELKTENAKPATNNPDNNKPTTALDIKSTDSKPTQITGVGSVLNTQNVSTDPDGNKTGGNNPTDTKLVNLGNATTPLSEDTLNSAATVRDIANMGWVVKATDNAYSDVVKNANEVNFVGTNLAKVTGETDTNGVRTITVDVNAQKTVEAADTPVVYTDADGNKLVKGEDGNFYPAGSLDNLVFNPKDKKYYPAGTTFNEQGQPNNNAQPSTLTPESNVIASMNDGDNTANTPKQLSNVKGNLTPTYNKGDKQENGDKRLGDTVVSTVTTNMAAPTDVKSIYNNAATVGDVLNAGWNLQGNGVAKDFVKPYDTVNFVNGTGTTVDVTTDENGKVSNVKVNTLLAPTNLNGDVLVKGNDNNWYKASEVTNGVPNNDATVQNAPTSVKVVNPADNTTSNPTKLGNVASSLNMKQVSTNPTGSTANPVPSENKELLNLEGTTDAPVNKNAAATVGDLQNMGWVVRAQGNGYSDVVKNANEVEFRGEGIEVNGKTEEGKRVITIKPLAQVLTTLEAELVNNTGGTGTGEPSGKITIAQNNNGGGFATAGNVKDMINAAGWRVQENGTTKDLVKAGDKVNFVNGAGTTVSVTTADGGESSDVKVNIDTTTLINKDGKVVEPVTNAADLVKAIEDAKKELANAKTPEATAEANRKLAEAEKNANDAGLNKVVTAQNVAEAINKSGFKLITGAVDGGTNATAEDTADSKLKSEGELINPADTVIMQAGKNMTVKHEKDGKITYATKDDVEFNTVKVGTAGTGTDTKQQVTLKTENATPANNNPDANKPTTALNISSGNDNKPTQITGVGSTLNTTTVNTNSDGKADTPDNADNKLVNLTETTVNPNSAATVGDLQNMGWVVKAKGNDYSDVVKNANEVEFVGTGLATVKGETVNGVRTITVDVNAQKTVEAADTPVIYTDKQGNKLAKGEDGKFYNADELKDAVYNPDTQTYSKDGAEIAAVEKDNVIASMNDGDNKADTPKQLSNVKGNLTPTYNVGDSKIATDGDNVGKPTDVTADKATTSEVAPTVEDVKAMYNNSATVGDVLNAGWNLQGNGVAKDFVKPYDTVNFVDGTGTKVEVNTDADGKVSTVKVNVDTVGLTNNPNGKVVTPAESLKAALDTAKAELDKLKADNAPEADVKAAEAKVADAQTAFNNAGNKIATAADVVNAINNSGFKLKTSATTGGEKDANSSADEVINPGDTVEMVAGKNLTVKQDTDGKVTYATKDDVEFNTVQVGGKVDDQGNKLVKVGDSYYKATDLTDGKPNAGAKPVENADVKDAPSVVFSADKGVATKDTKLGTDGKEITTPNDAPTALSVKDKDGKDSQINGIASALDTKEVATKPLTVDADGNPVANKQTGKDTLVDLSNVNKPLADTATPEEKAAAEKLASSALTVKDAANMGWIVSASGNEYVDTVKNANKVDFKGKNGISVTGKTTADGVREITVSLEKGEVIGANEGTVKIDGKDTDVVKVGDEYFKKEDIDPTTGKPKEGTTALGNDVVGNNGENVVNNGNKLVDGHTVAKAIQESGFTVGKETDTSGVDFNNSDEKVNPNDELRFADGKGTTVSTGTVKTIDPNGEVSTKTVVKVDVDTGVITNNANGSLKGIVSAADAKKLNDDLAKAQDALAAIEKLGENAPQNVKDAAKAAVYDAEKAIEKAGLNKVATVQNVADAINQSGWNAAVANVGSGVSVDKGGDALVNPGDTVTMTAGNNMQITKDGLNYTIETQKDVTFNSVTADTVNIGPVTLTGRVAHNPDGSTTNELSVGSPSSPTRITNVAPGVNDTDAVNVSQLKGVQNNINQRFGDVYQKMDREHKNLRAGIAGAAALAGIPEVHVAGRSMIAAAASAYKSENAIAVGYSRLSDNSKIKLKLTGSANSRGDVMGTVGVGYMW